MGKKRFSGRRIAKEYILFFEHDIHSGFCNCSLGQKKGAKTKETPNLFS